MRKIRIIFVCLGNYCRSPMAEAIFKALADRDGLSEYFDVSSAGTRDWDVGLPPDHRIQSILHQYNYPLDPHKLAEQIIGRQIDSADYVIVMTEDIAKELGSKDNVYLLTDFVDQPSTRNIPDPYPTDSFPEVFQLIEPGVKAFYIHVKNLLTTT